MKNKLKNILLVFLALLLLGGCQRAGRLAKKQPVQVKSMCEKGDNFIFCIMRENCETCAAYEENLKTLTLNYDVVVYYIIVNDEILDNDADTNDLIYNYLGFLDVVPTTYLLKKGHVIDLREGNIEYNDLEDWLNDYGYIKK